MDLEKSSNDSMIIKYQNTDNVFNDICSIIDSAKNYGVRIDIWTHFMRGCIIELCTPI